MKIRKQHSPGTGEPSAMDVGQIVVAFKRDATTDTELYATEALLAEFEQEGAMDDGHTPSLEPIEDLGAYPRIAVNRSPDEVVFVTAAVKTKPPSAWPVYLVALVMSVLWAGAPIAFAYGYRQAKSPFDFDPFVMLVLGAMAIGPAALVWVVAYIIQQGRKLSAETQRAKQLADDMIAPALAAGLQVSEIGKTLRAEMVHAADAAEAARLTLHGLREALASESERLATVTAQSAVAAGDLTRALSSERAEMADMAKALETRSDAIAQTITDQTRRVTDASDLAEAQLREAEALLTARAADLTAAAGIASDSARTAGEDLTRHIARLEMAGLGVAEQISSVDKGLSEQRAGLVSITHALRADQDMFAAQAESHSAQLTDFISQARLSTEEMGDRALEGGESLKALMVAAAEQFRDLAVAAKAERDSFGASTHEALSAVSKAAADERARLETQTREAIEALGAAAEKTRAAADRHAEIAREQVDQLSEAAFTAGQKANRVFETRLTEARELIERSADMVEQAGAATAQKLAEGSQAARSALEELAQMLAAIEQRAARLPAAAKGQAEQVRLAVTESMDDLMDQARRTAQETQAIDAAFQDRVRRNYEMLTDAVRLMGSVAGAAGSLSPTAERITPVEPPPPLRVRAPRAAPVAEVPIIAEPKVARTPAKSTRLKLTPTASDEEFSQVFEEAGGSTKRKATTEPEGWTWKDLLTSLDTQAAPKAAVAVDESLVGDIEDLGLDPQALLPDQRIDQIAAAVEAHDVDGARAVVRKLAPAAIRRLARHMSEDKAFRRRASGFVGQYQDRLAEAADLDPATIEGLLSSDLGRVYLLLETASADLV